jgi:DNA mismatch endonuclease, patch repair protein
MSGRSSQGEKGRPSPLNAIVSAQMSRMPRTSTGPEMELRRALHAAGLRFRTHDRSLPGTPDVVFPKARMAVFVDGCFWHGCPDHGVLPKSNRDWWREKLETNRKRDQRKDAALADLGWVPVHFWEHEALDDMVGLVLRLWRERTGRSDSP